MAHSKAQSGVTHKIDQVAQWQLVVMVLPKKKHFPNFQCCFWNNKLKNCHSKSIAPPFQNIWKNSNDIIVDLVGVTLSSISSCHFGWQFFRDNSTLRPFHIYHFQSTPFNDHMWKLNFFFVFSSDTNTYLNSIKVTSHWVKRIIIF